MEAYLLTIRQLSEFLGIKVKTLYAMIPVYRIPCFKIGRLLRFKQSDIEKWIETKRKDCLNIDHKALNILRKTSSKSLDVDGIIKKSIEEVNQEG